MNVAGAIAEGPLFLGPVITTKLRVLAVAVGAALILGAHLLIRKTQLGRAMRATFQDPMAASLVGIRTKHVYGATLALGCTLAALSGMLLAPIYSAPATTVGLISLKRFVVVTLKRKSVR